MNKFHVTVVALLFAGAAVLGAVAVTRTTHLGSAAQQANNASVSARAKQLTAYAAKLQHELKAHPPALPALPKPAAAGAGTNVSAPRIVYHRPPTVVVTLHRHGGDDGSDGGGGDG